MPPKQRATYDDLRKLPDHVVGEILAGELFASARTAPVHANATRVLAGELDPFGRGPGGSGPGAWWILFEPELRFRGGDVLVPDLAGWRRERMPQLPRTAAIELPPDWVCEVVSPSTAGIDRIRKLPIYGREGVGHAWIVDVVERMLEVFRRGDDGLWKLVQSLGEGAPALVRIEPFEAIEVELGRIWADAAPPG